MRLALLGQCVSCSAIAFGVGLLRFGEAGGSLAGFLSSEISQTVVLLLCCLRLIVVERCFESMRFPNVLSAIGGSLRLEPTCFISYDDAILAVGSACTERGLWRRNTARRDEVCARSSSNRCQWASQSASRGRIAQKPGG